MGTYLFRSNKLQNDSNDFDLRCSELGAVDEPGVTDVPEKLAYSQGVRIACGTTSERNLFLESTSVFDAINTQHK